MGEVATRVMGSRDILSAANWPEKMSVNYISYHDGFTLQDLVSYRKNTIMPTANITTMAMATTVVTTMGQKALLTIQPSLH